MNDTQLFKFKHCLAGMENAEKVFSSDLTAMSDVRTVTQGLMECQEPELFSEFMSDRHVSTPVAMVPIGLLFWDSLPLIIDWGRADFFLDGMSATCAGVSVGILVSNAMFETPTGIWGNEVAAVMSGINDNFVALIDHAVSLVAMSDPIESIATLRDQGDMMTFIVAASLYYCVAARGSYERAVELAGQCKSLTGDVLALTGALMGIVDPDGVGELGGCEALAANILEIRP